MRFRQLLEHLFVGEGVRRYLQLGGGVGCQQPRIDGGCFGELGIVCCV
jgi:hypothetical protein